MKKTNASRLILTMLVVTVLGGCATSRKEKVVVEPGEPPKIKLVALPEYGVEKSGYDTSAGCYVLGMYGMDNPITAQLSKSLAEGLAQRGYPVVEINGLSTAEDRTRTEKIIKFGLYSCRSQYLPREGKTATDIFLIVSVLDKPNTILDSNLVMRDFNVWGRDIAIQLDLEGITTGKAIDNAIGNLFTLDGFRQSLEPSKTKVVQR